MTILAFLLILLWTGSISFVLYITDAHLHYQEIYWAIAIGFSLIITHMVNMAIYFKVRGNKPYLWQKYKRKGSSI